MEDSFKVMALLDTGAKMYIMTKELIKKINLAMRKKLKLEFVSHTGYSRFFLGLCEDVEIAIEGLKTRHPIFIVKARGHNFSLGQPFLNFMKFSQEYKLDGIFGTITHLNTHQITVFFILTFQDPANQREN